ncbi:heme-dependent oxidative N-demethylase subunit alpha family protein [Ramlibacter sp.]|uniref:heme-dependent oxidative N-demethylase subunit alpha family protein n=1 Tax=Ramlibacter sp. TaxID=1917967 RepID=UPI002C60C508|nr:heme-dependent oxidative N-demethylase subunit alpha family protein [Ramlibacter sp.]HWI83428.1 heme-dependent oxidative N-demethylase subunit alpha family protein [Ramlibacter sp.]
MDFDFNLIGVPFGMRPGLRRLADGAAQLTPLAPHSRLAQEKRAVLEAGRSRHVLAGFDAGPALAAVAAHAATVAGCRFAADAPPELAFEEDLAILDGATGTLPWLCVCVPSHWAPEEKLGLDFAALHAPVADNAALVAASRQLVALATGGDRWERHVWTVSPSGRFDQHPARHPLPAWPSCGADPERFAAQCWLRAERQTFFPVGRGTRQAVFTIRVMLQPLRDAVRAPWQAQRLHDALASMSPAVLAYKNLALAREPLLRWLATCA